jgi:hypothetical protein
MQLNLLLIFTKSAYNAAADNGNDEMDGFVAAQRAPTSSSMLSFVPRPPISCLVL